MADITDELDALFDDEEAEQEEAVEEAVAEEEAEASKAAEPAPKAKAKAKIGGKMAGKKPKIAGTRTGGIPIGKKAGKGTPRPVAAKPGKSAPKPKPEPEPEEAAPTRGVRTKVAPAPSGGGKGLLLVSVVLNVVLLVAVMVTMLKVGGLATDVKADIAALKKEMSAELTSVKNAATTASNVSRVKFGMVTDPTLGRQAVMVIIPTDVTKVPSLGKAYPMDLSQLLRNRERDE